MIHAISDQDFEKIMGNNRLPCLIVFWARWQNACQQLDPLWQELDQQYKGRLAIFSVDVDENAHLPAIYGLNHVPHITFVHRGQNLGYCEGRRPLMQYRNFVDEQMRGFLAQREMIQDA